MGGTSSLPLAGVPRKRGEDNKRVVAMAPPASALHPLPLVLYRLRLCDCARLPGTAAPSGESAVRAAPGLPRARPRARLCLWAGSHLPLGFGQANGLFAVRAKLAS